MKINNLEELKQFILWAKSQKVASVTLGDMSFIISEMAHVPDYGLAPMPPAESLDQELETKEYTPNSKTWTDSELEPEKEEDLLFWSAKPN